MSNRPQLKFFQFPVFNCSIALIFRKAKNMAERQGFEPRVLLRVQQISSLPP